MRILCVMVVMMAISFQSRSQYISIGPGGGIGASWISKGDVIGDLSPQILWNAGVIFVYSNQSHWGFGADLKYSAEGYSFSTPVLGSTIDVDYHLNYLRLPLHAIYFFGEYGQKVRPKVFLGVTPGLLLSATANNSLTGSVDEKEEFNSFDLGVNAGVGVNIRLAERLWLNADLQYYQGFLDVTNEDGSNLNSNAALNVGVAFGFGGTTTTENK